MTTYYIPVAYYCSDDNYVGHVKTYMVDADSEEEAIEKYKGHHYREEYNDTLQWIKGHKEKYGTESCYYDSKPATYEEWLNENTEMFWKEDEDPEEEGWVIGKITTELTHIP